MREKLIELLDGWDCPILLAVCEAESLADYLIANGVTVREKATWGMRMDDSGWFNYYSCSLCGTNLADDDWNYCPHCGADMRGEEHETD